MKRPCTTIAAMLFCLLQCGAQHLLTPFEKSGGKRSATYEECISFYHKLFHRIRNTDHVDGLELDNLWLYTDAKSRILNPFVYPANEVVRMDTDFKEQPETLTILLNNGIHPGEPDGIDASMMVARDLAEGRINLSKGLRLVIIPVYNIGGILNRNSTSRVNQNGPEEYGFRGNSQNLDLNRDFIKQDAYESRSFQRLFSYYDPAIFIDTHVSDGADYQHTMTLLSTQYDKLGGKLGTYFRERLDPMLYRRMERTGWPMVPYVNAEETPEKGWTAFYDPPRFSSGYAALFNTIAWVPETHMLKPFKQRVMATYELLKQMIMLAGKERDTILALRRIDRGTLEVQTQFPLSWKPDTSRATMWPFLGFAAAYKKSEVTGLNHIYYDHSKPLNIPVPIRDHYVPAKSVSAPKAYVMSNVWFRRCRFSFLGMNMGEPLDYRFLEHDTFVNVTAYTIDSFKTSPTPYEGHYKHTAIHATPKRTKILFHSGDYIVNVSGPARRFLIEALEPEGEDSYFAWGFFDAILQRKEGYADYRWEDVAAQELKEHPEIKAALEAKKTADPAFAKDAAAQLLFVYQHSKWLEPEYMRYPVYRIE